MSVITARSSRRTAGPLFVAPFLLLFVLLFLAPLGYAAYLSLFEHKLIGGTTFVGLDNYVTAVKDPQLIHGVLRVATFFLIQVPVMLMLTRSAALAPTTRPKRDSTTAANAATRAPSVAV